MMAERRTTSPDNPPAAVLANGEPYRTGGRYSLADGTPCRVLYLRQPHAGEPADHTWRAVALTPDGTVVVPIQHLHPWSPA